MSDKKYPFFGKVGRPSKKEISICKKINKLIDGNTVSKSEIDELTNMHGVPTDLGELENFYSTLTGEEYEAASKVKPKRSETDTPPRHDDSPKPPNEVEEDFSDYENDGMGYGVDDNVDNIDIPKSDQKTGAGSEAVDFNPFKEPVIKREYTKGFEGLSDHSEEDEDSQDDYQDDYQEGHSDKGDSSHTEFSEEEMEKPNNFSDSVADDISSGQSGFGDQGMGDDSVPEPDYIQHLHNTEDDDDADDADFEEEDGESDEGKMGGDNLEDLSPAQKRKSAEKTAEALMDMYGKFAPLPFKSWAKISDRKVQQMIFNQEIDPNMEVERGVTVQNYIDAQNEEVEDIFTVDEDTKESIKDPLIDVLMEQEMALTPTQRLMMAVGSHVVSMGFAAYQLSQNNKQALETFKQFRSEQAGSSSNSSRSSSSSSAKRSESTSKKQETPNYSDDDIQPHEEGSVQDFMNSFSDNSGSEDKEKEVIDPNSDDTVSVEETEED